MSYYEQGKACMKSKEYQKAAENFKKSAEMGEDKNAEKMWKNATEEYGEQVNKLGDKLYKKKKYKEAMEYYLDSISLMIEAGNERKTENYKKELRKSTEKLGQSVNKNGDKLMKDKKFKEAIEVYQESVDLMQSTGNEKKLANFQGELKQARIKRSMQLLEQAKKLAKDEKLEDALILVKEAQSISRDTEDKDFIKKIKEMSLNIYEIVAEEKNQQADKLFKKKKWEEAIHLYKESVDLIKKAKNEKRLANFQKELAKAFKQNAAEINKAGDKAFKEKRYENAIEIYQESVEVAKLSGDQKLVTNFEKELAKSFENLSKKVNEEGDKLFKAKQFEEAAKIYVRSISLAQNSKKEKLVKNFTGELRKTYTTWGLEINKQGDSLFKQKKYEEAIEKYKKSVEIVETTGDAKLIEKYQKELLGTYNRWADETNKEGDLAYKTKDYEKAYQLYQKSVDLSELSRDKKDLKRYRKERDKALKKLQ